MTKYWICLPLLIVSNLSSAMTYEQRLKVSDVIESSIVTMQAKYLPPKLVKNTMAAAVGMDREILKSVYASWSKNHSSFLRLENQGDSILFSYKYIPLLKMRVVALEPYTVMLNEHREVVLKRGEGLSALKAALNEEGFGSASKRHAMLLQLLREANADEASAQPEKTFENSVILMGDWGRDAVSKSTVPLVEQGFLLPDSRYKWFQALQRQDRISCNGQTASGTIADADGTLLNFKASRSEGVEFENDGVTIKVGTKPFASENCDAMTKLPESLDSEPVKRVISDQEIETLHWTFITNSVSSFGGKIVQSCIDQNIKDANQYLGRDPRAEREFYNSEYEDYQRRRADNSYRTRTADAREFESARIPSREVQLLFKAKCQWEYSKSRSSDAVKQELAKAAADAEASWATESQYQIGRLAAGRLSLLTDTCRKAKEAKPKLDLDCATPTTIAQGKKLCAQLSKSLVNVGSELRTCYADKTCEDQGRLPPSRCEV